MDSTDKLKSSTTTTGGHEQIRVRAAAAGDLPALAEVDQAVWTDGTTPIAMTAFERALLRQRGLEDTFVAERGGQVVGFVFVGRKGPHPADRHVCRLRELAVAPSAARTGVGTALLAHAIAHARAGGFRKLTLSVLATNEAAVRLYERAGFAVEARLVEEFCLGGRYVDDLVLALRLT